MNKPPISFFIVVHLAANRIILRRRLTDVIGPCASTRCGAAICPESGQEQTSQIGVTKSVFDPKATSANLKVVGSISGFKGTCQRHIAVGE